jgi:hypothetical protein
MSTKTIKQRIAVVAVSALTAGLFSVVSAPASNAAVGTTAVGPVNNAATSNLNPKLTHYDTLFVATVASGTGSGAALTATGDNTLAPDTASGAGPATSSAKSLGLVNVSDIGGGLTAGTTQTAVLLSSGSLSVYTATEAGKYSSITVTGGTFSASTGTSMNATSTVVAHGSTTLTTFGAVAKPSSGSTQMIVRLYTGQTTLAGAAASPTSGTLTGQITVTVTSASVAGAFSPVYSGVFGTAYNNADLSLAADSATYLGAAPYNTDMWLNVRAKDAYNTPINSGTAGLLQVTATNGGLVAFGSAQATAAATDGTTSTAFVSTATPDNWSIQVSNPDTAPRITTVTVSFNGVAIGSKTMQFLGEVAKVTLSSPVIGKTSGSANNANYMLYDASGAAVYPSGPLATANTAYTLASLLNDASVNGSGTASAATKSQALSISSSLVVTTGKVQYTCGATAGNGTIGLTYTNPSGTIVKSNALAVKCAGSALTYSASWDKATYIPGDLAKLTVKFLDSKGNLANGVDAVANTNVQDTPSFSIGGLDKTIAGPASNDSIEDGVLTYTYTVGATEGAYTGKIIFPVVDARQIAAGASSAAVVPVTLTVKAATTAVSNADVLKSIVSLIASINKQIQALQKLILKR